MVDGKGLTNSFLGLVQGIREKSGLTREQLADLAGVHRTTIGLLERKERTPTLQVSSQIATALGATLSELIQESELIAAGKANTEELSELHTIRAPSIAKIRNEDKLIDTIGIEGSALVATIDKCYKTLDTIDEQLMSTSVPPIGTLVELANLSSMVGNLLGAGIADASNGIYTRNKPHSYPDLLPLKAPGVELELKMSLETNRPKGHLPKPGTYIAFRYVLGDRFGNFTRGKNNRGNTVWIWEVKVGTLRKEDFACSNTDGDSGKTAIIKSDVHNKMPLVYYAPEFLPYAPRKDATYVGYN